MALVMLGFVVVGFMRSFFLRPLFDTYDVPGYVLVHGGFMTLWFVWYVVQTGLAARGRVDLERRMGVSGVVVGVLTIISGGVAGFGTVTRNRLAGRDIEAELAHFSDVVWSNMSSVVVFACFFALALCLRRRPESHMRLMLLATMSLMGPALSRMWVLPIIDVWPGVELNTLVFYYGGMAALPLALVVHDVMTTRRLHPVTLLGVPGLFASLQLVSSVVPATELGRAIIRVL